MQQLRSGDGLGQARDDGHRITGLPSGRTDRLADREAAGREPVFRLSRSVGIGGDNEPDDVIGAKRALGWAGYYPSDLAQTPTADASLEGDPQFLYGIRRFQADSGLSADSFMRRDGETATALNSRITPLVLAAAPAAPAPGRAGTPMLMPVGGPAWRQPDAWGNPAGWALEQAGEAIGGFLGVDEDPPSPQQLGPADQAGGDVQQDVPMVTARDGRTYPELSSLPEERWRQVQLTTPEFKRGTQWVRTYGPIRIAHYSGAAVPGADGIYYHVEWYNAGANEEVVPEYSAGGPRRPHGGHATSLSGPSYEYLYPEQPSEHGWWVEITIPQQPAVNGATIGNTLRVHRLVEKAE